MFYTNVALVGNKIHMRYIENGIRKQNDFSFSPELFIKSKKGNFRDLYHNSYKSIEVENVKIAKEKVKSSSNIEDYTICGNAKPEFEFIHKNFPENISFDSSQINIAYLDIEVFTDGAFPEPSAAKYPINAISFRIHGMTHAFGLTYDNVTYKSKKDDVTVYLFDTEEKLLTEFINFWSKCELDVISGWNSNSFDIPYICRRIENVFGERYLKRLSPYSKVFSTERKNDFGNKEIAYKIYGISQIDYLAIYKKFTFKNRESYKLDFIAQEELGEHKEDVSDYDNLFDLYEKDFELFMDYNIKDTELVERLDDRLKLMEIALTLAYFSKVNYEDIFSPMRYWENIIQNYLYEHQIVVPIEKPENEKTKKFEGAYVKDPIVGKHDFMVSFDFTALYPYILRTFNISPETIQGMRYDLDVESILNQSIDLSSEYEKDITVAANGARFTRKHTGFIPALIKRMLDLRVDSKKEMIKTQQKIEEMKKSGENLNDIKLLEKKAVALFNMQLVAKVAANSFYGICGLKYFRFYDIRLAEAVTYSGQAANRFVEKKVNEYLNKLLETENKDYTIYMDTDSCYFDLSGMVNKFVPNKTKQEQNEFVKKVGYSKLTECIDNAIDSFNKYLNVHDAILNMKMEAVGGGVFIAKKKYVMSIVHMEGVDYAKPKLKMTGVEAVKSSTPAPARKALTDCANILVTGTEDELIEYVKRFRKEWNGLSPDQIGLPTSVNGIFKYHTENNKYSLGCPIHVRAAINYNYWISEYKIDMHYSDIKDGSKAKYVFLINQNYTRENVIAFPSKLPKELDLHSKIDYNAQLERSFLSPLKIMLEPTGWNYEKKVNLMDLFS